MYERVGRGRAKGQGTYREEPSERAGDGGSGEEDGGAKTELGALVPTEWDRQGGRLRGEWIVIHTTTGRS